MSILPFLLPALIAHPPTVERTVLAMGTQLSLALEGTGAATVSEQLLAEAARLERACSTWNPESAWSRLNAAQGRPVPLDAEWLNLLAQAQTWSRDTGGAFDPVLMAQLRAWDLRGKGRTPDAEARAQARQASGCALLHLDPATGTATLRHPEAGVEEGGFLKGYALDRMRELAQHKGIEHGLLDFGGQLLAWGPARRVDIASPRDRQRPVARLRLANASLSTSGCSERGRHLLDPRSGTPAPNWGAVTVVHPSALAADILSTALFVLGPEAGFAYAEARDLPALFLSHGAPPRATTAFANLNPSFH